MSENCPECGNTSFYKERISGQQTGDLVCKKCGYTDHPNAFSQPENEPDED